MVHTCPPRTLRHDTSPQELSNTLGIYVPPSGKMQKQVACSLSFPWYLWKSLRAEKASSRRYAISRPTYPLLRIHRVSLQLGKSAISGRLMWFYLWESQGSKHKSVGLIPQPYVRVSFYTYSFVSPDCHACEPRGQREGLCYSFLSLSSPGWI